jgi:hypothetical protein
MKSFNIIFDPSIHLRPKSHPFYPLWEILELSEHILHHPVIPVSIVIKILTLAYFKTLMTCINCFSNYTASVAAPTIWDIWRSYALADCSLVLNRVNVFWVSKNAKNVGSLQSCYQSWFREFQPSVYGQEGDIWRMWLRLSAENHFVQIYYDTILKVERSVQTNIEHGPSWLEFIRG